MIQPISDFFTVNSVLTKCHVIFDDVTGRYLQKNGLWKYKPSEEGYFQTIEEARAKALEYYEGLGTCTIVYQGYISELEKVVNRYLEKNYRLVGGVCIDAKGDFYQAIVPSV